MGRGKGGRKRGRSRRGRGGRGRGHSRRSPRALLRSVLDKTLEGVTASLPVHQGQVEGEPVAVLLHFEGETELGVTFGSDGESIRVSRKQVSPYPKEDPEMDVVPEEQTEADQWMAFVGKSCQDVREVRDMSFGGKGIWTGLELEFEGGAVLSLYNWGDDLVLDDVSKDFEHLEKKSVRRKPGEGDDDDGPRGGSSGRRGSSGEGSGGGREPREDDSGKKGSGRDDSGGKGSDDGGGGDGGGDGGRKKRRRRRRRRRRSGSDEEE